MRYLDFIEVCGRGHVARVASYCVGSVGVMRTRGTCDPRLIRLQGCGGRGVAAEGEKVIYYRK